MAPVRVGNTIGPAVKLAIREACSRGRKAIEWRRSLIAELRASLSDIADIERSLRTRAAHLIPPSVATIVGGVRVLCVAVLIEATAWPDTELPACLLFGAAATGIIPNTGVFSLLPDLRPGKDPESLAAFQHNTQEFMSQQACMDWAATLARNLQGRGENARPEQQAEARTLCQKGRDEQDNVPPLCGHLLLLDRLLLDFSGAGGAPPAGQGDATLWRAAGRGQVQSSR